MRTRLVIAPFVLILAHAGCAARKTGVTPAQLRMFAPLPKPVQAEGGAAAASRIALGRMLYYEPRLSKSQTVSCNSCHDLAKYGVDGQPTSEGFKGQRGDRNSPTVYNAAWHFVQFWDGRAADVEAQAKGPVLNPVEMAMRSDTEVVAVLKSIPGYVALFRKAFPDSPDPVTYDNMATAIGAFERGLATPSRWDKFLGGDRKALTGEEHAGLNTFLAAGCQTCHSGALLGGNVYQKIGARKPYPDVTDSGRYSITHNETDRFVFKVPSLRNVEMTAPYFHHGRVGRLDQAVGQMGEYQLNRQLTTSEVASIITFLKSLTGEVPAAYIRKPELPKGEIPRD